MSSTIPEPRHSLFLKIDKAFDQSVALHCIGGFAMAMLHGLPRPTVDVDCLAVIPAGETARLQSLAGEGSALRKKYGFAEEWTQKSLGEESADHPRRRAARPKAWRRS